MAKKSIPNSKIYGLGKLNFRPAEQARVELTLKQQKHIRALYNKAADDISKQAEKIPKDSQMTSHILRKQYLDKLQKQIDHNLDLIKKDIDATINGSMKYVIDSVVSDNLSFLDSLGLPIEGAFSWVPDEVIRTLSSGKMYQKGWTLSKAIWGQDKKTQNDVQSVIAQGIAQNKSAYDIAKDLEKYVDPSARKDWSWSKVYPGTNKVVDYNAQRLARTMVSHAYQQAFVVTTQKNPFVTKYRWLASGGKRMCPLCEARNGQLFDKDSLPLDHPMGMCTFEAVIPDSMEDIANRLGDWVDGKEDPELDQWVNYMYPQGKGPSLVPQFNDVQKQFLSPLGYTPDHMPATTSEFLHALDSEAQDKLLSLAGGSWSDSHPFQIMGKYYEDNLAKVGKGGIKVPKPKKAKAPKIKPTLDSPTSPSAFNNIDSSFTPFMDTLLKGQRPDYYTKDAQIWWKSLTGDEKKAIKRYTGSSYGWMNRALRGDTVGDLGLDEQRIIEKCQSALLKYSSSQDIVVRRGSSLNSLLSMCGKEKEGYPWMVTHKDELIGTIASDKGFMSTSPIQGGGFGGSVEYKIFVPKGSPAPYVDEFSSNSGEQETLLPAGTIHRIIGVEEINGRWVVYMEYLGLLPK